MFTGIVEETGVVARAEATANGFSLGIRASKTVEDTRPGDSIAVNGTCLTVVSLGPDSFFFDVAPESLSRTNLGALRHGDTVNLERSVTPTTRMGGHFVQGHVDGTGTVTAVKADGESVWLTIEVGDELKQWIVPKGYVALDGISLTVVQLNDRGFDVMLVPYTMAHVSSRFREVGYPVNVEVDILGKYVSNIIDRRLAAGSAEVLHDKG